MEIKMIFSSSPSLKDIEIFKGVLNGLYETDFHYSIDQSINTRVIFNDN